MRVEQELAAGLQGREGRGDVLAVPVVLEVAEAAPEAGHDVERVLRQLAHVADAPIDLDAGLLGRSSRVLDERLGDVDACDVVTAGCELDRMPAHTARRVHQLGTLRQVVRALEEVNLLDGQLVRLGAALDFEPETAEEVTPP